MVEDDTDNTDGYHSRVIVYPGTEVTDAESYRRVDDWSPLPHIDRCDIGHGPRCVVWVYIKDPGMLPTQALVCDRHLELRGDRWLGFGRDQVCDVVDKDCASRMPCDHHAWR